MSWIASCLAMTAQKKQQRILLLSVECPAKLSNFFEDFNKIVGFIEKHYVFNNKEV